MAGYDFSTRAGFQLAMKDALSTTSPSEIEHYAQAAVTPTFYHIMNGKRLSYEEWFASLEAWSGKITGYEPVVEEFLRDGDQLAARMTGVLALDGKQTYYESSFFAKIDAESGKLAWLIERAVWGEVEQEDAHGAS